MKKIKYIFTSIIIILLAGCSSTGSIIGNNTDRRFELILVNKDNTLPKNVDLSFVDLANGQKVEKRIYPDLQKMFDDMRARGLDPIVNYGYRSHSTQKEIFDSAVKERMKTGMSKKEAVADAMRSVAFPGTSEHELGLAVDIISKSGNNSAVYQWLASNSYKYGFILRYPADKTDITGVHFEPWHYRYVGKEHSKIIYQKSMCLEEYLSK